MKLEEAIKNLENTDPDIFQEEYYETLVIALEAMKMIQKRTKDYPSIGVVLGNKWLTEEEIKNLGIR